MSGQKPSAGKGRRGRKEDPESVADSTGQKQQLAQSYQPPLPFGAYPPSGATFRPTEYTGFLPGFPPPAAPGFAFVYSNVPPLMPHEFRGQQHPSQDVVCPPPSRYLLPLPPPPPPPGPPQQQVPRPLYYAQISPDPPPRGKRSSHGEGRLHKPPSTKRARRSRGEGTSIWGRVSRERDGVLIFPLGVWIIAFFSSPMLLFLPK
jgi:hypothetical protein